MKIEGHTRHQKWKIEIKEERRTITLLIIMFKIMFINSGRRKTKVDDKQFSNTKNKRKTIISILCNNLINDNHRLCDSFYRVE